MQKLLQYSTDKERQGRLQGNLAYYMSAAEKPELALKAIQRSVILFESLNEAKPQVYRAHLAQSLARMTEILLQLGRFADALNIARKSLLHTQILAREGSQEKPDFRHAHSLRLMSVCLLETGDHSSALKYAMQSVDLFRECIPINPSVFFPRFVTALDILFNCLRAMPNGNEKTVILKSSRRFSVRLRFFKPFGEALS